MSQDFLPAHGGDRQALARFSGRDAGSIIDFSVNTRPDGPPEYLRLAMIRAMNEAGVYPSPDAVELRELCARRYGLSPDGVVFGNGTSELLHALARVLVKRGCPLAVIPEPAFADYARACATAGLPCGHPACALREDARRNLLDWELPREAILAAPEGACVFLANPGNPAGTWLSPRALATLAQERPDMTWVLDEAFVTYAGRDSLASCLGRIASPNHLPNLVILRSLTKFHALAGARVGWLAADPELALAVRAELPTWNVNCFAMACARAVLENGPEARRDERLARAANRAGRRRLAALLSPLPLKLCRSCASYLLMRLNRPAPDLARRLLREHGIALRDCANYHGLKEGRWFRVAVRGPEDCRRLAAALRALLGARPGATAPAPARRRTPALMVQGTCSGAGKSVLCAAFCRILRQDGYDVAPFKAQNMSLNSGVTMDGLEMGRAQILQARAAGLPPDARMNPVLLKPLTDKGSQVILLGRPRSTLDARAFLHERRALRAPICEAYHSLASEHEVMVLEGAGSPAEVNLKEADLVNMNMAREAGARVILAGDIDRGGVYASFLGSWLTFSGDEKALLAGFCVNRFRGDASLLAPAHDYMLRATGLPVLGVVPWISQLRLPEEDSLSLAASLREPASLPDPLDVVMVVLGRASNFTDMAPVGAEPDVSLRLVREAKDWGRPDLVVLPGSRSVAADMARLKAAGLDRLIFDHARAGGWVVGLCGGMQIMGERLLDPDHVESDNESMQGLGLLPLTTTLASGKVLTRLEHVATPFGPETSGYEIHHGHTHVTAAGADMPRFTRPGQTDEADLLGLTHGRLVGTYLHGLFDDDTFRRAFLDTVRKSLGKRPRGRILTRWNPDAELDRLADVVRASLDMPALYRLLGLR